MMLLTQSITQKFSTPTNNRLCTSSNTRNQAVIHDGRVGIQTKNDGFGGNGNRNTERQNRNQAANTGNGQNVQCDNCNVRGHYSRDCPKPKVCEAKYFREQMLLVMKDEAGGILNEEENDFMLDKAYGDETLEELIAIVIMMAQIQPADNNAKTEPKYDAKAVSEVNALHIDLISSIMSKGVHEHTNHEKLKTIINTSDDDQIDCNIIFDYPYVEDNGGTVEQVKCSNSVKRPKYKDTKSKNKVLKNTKVKSPSTNVQMVSSSVSMCSNKRETMNSTVRQSNTNVLKAKTINSDNDGSNIIYVSCGKDVFMLSHEKCVARYALFVDSRVKRALFIFPVAAKSRNLGVTLVVAKSRNDHFAAITGYGYYVQDNLKYAMYTTLRASDIIYFRSDNFVMEISK
nr:hypothetical protein [Tanacetum cinerariifolium]